MAPMAAFFGVSVPGWRRRRELLVLVYGRVNINDHVFSESVWSKPQTDFVKLDAVVSVGGRLEVGWEQIKSSPR